MAVTIENAPPVLYNWDSCRHCSRHQKLGFPAKQFVINHLAKPGPY